MAIARDNHAHLGSSGSFTCTGSNLVLVVFVLAGTTTDDVTSVTYNGVGMTKIDSALPTSDRWISSWVLVNPATGSNTLSANGSAIGMFALSYTGAKQSGQPDAHGITTSDNVAAISKSITTIADNCWTVAMTRTNVVKTETGNSGTTLLDNDGNPSGYSMDSNGAITPAGSTSLGTTWSGNANSAGIVILSIAPDVFTFQQLINTSDQPYPNQVGIVNY